ncbi:MAG: SDR family oxidoreductase [Myxococcota bacterium]
MSDKTVMITGAAGGMGRALSEAFMAAGARVALLDIDELGLERTAQALTETVAPSGRVLKLAVDVREPGQCAAAVEVICGLWGGIDLVVNSAGVSHRSAFAQTNLSVVRRVMEVNFFGAVHCTQAALSSLLARRGQVVVLSGIAGLGPLPEQAGYVASKYALHGFFETLRMEVEPHGVDVLVVCPGPTRTHHRALDGEGERMDENAPWTALEPGAVAQAVVQACRERRKRLLLVSPMPRLAFWLSRWMPQAYERLVRVWMTQYGGYEDLSGSD